LTASPARRDNRRMNRALALMLLATLVACSPKPKAVNEASKDTPPGVVKIKEVMRDQIEPNAQIYWHSSGTVDTATGTLDLAPTTEEGWKKTADALDAIQDGARLLRQPVRAQGRADWIRHVDKLTEQIKLSQAAVKARDKDAMFMTGGDLYSVCTGCHQQYLLPYLGPDGRPKKIDENGTPIANPLGK
jgi:hypothetical protein